MYGSGTLTRFSYIFCPLYLISDELTVFADENVYPRAQGYSCSQYEDVNIVGVHSLKDKIPLLWTAGR